MMSIAFSAKGPRRMPRYLIQAAYEPLAKSAFARIPQDRTAAIRTLVQRAGGSVEAIYFCLGEYDVLAIIDVPDDVSVAALSLAANEPGHLRRYTTTKLITSDEFFAAQQLASHISFDPPRIPD
jgi:uncharacterized protein with GYD domain